MMRARGPRRVPRQRSVSPWTVLAWLACAASLAIRLSPHRAIQATDPDMPPIAARCTCPTDAFRFNLQDPSVIDDLPLYHGSQRLPAPAPGGWIRH